VTGVRVGTSERSLESLAAAGWLFEAQKPKIRSSSTGWNYWTLFDFSKIEWHALSAGVENYFLLLGIGTLVLAVFLQATAGLLCVPGIDLNYEMRLHGYSNVVAAMFGTLSGSLV
jgi:SulP family sulfate permease